MTRFVAVLAFLTFASPDGLSNPNQAEHAWQANAHLLLTTTRNDTTTTRVASYRLMLASDRFRIDFGQIAILGTKHHSAASIVAWHTRDPQSVFIAHTQELGSIMRQHLPALWCSPLARMITSDQYAHPLVGHAWSDTPEVQSPDQFTLILSKDRLTIERLTDEQTGLIVRETIRSTEPHAEFQLHISYEWSKVPAPAHSPSSWGIDPTGRTHVPAISALTARPPAIDVGRTVTPLRLFDPQGRLWSAASVFRAEPTASTPRYAQLLVLILHAALEREGGIQATVSLVDLIDFINQTRTEHALDAARDAEPRQRVIVRVVAVFDVPDYDPARLAEIAQIAERIEPDPLMPGLEAAVPRMLIAHPPRETIDLFTPGASTVVLVIDDASRLVDAIRLDTGTEVWKSALARLLNPGAHDQPQQTAD